MWQALRRLGLVSGEQTRATLEEMDQRWGDRCVYAAVRGVWERHRGWLETRAALADTGHPRAAERAAGGDEVDRLYRALERCDAFYAQPMWGSEPEGADAPRIEAQLRRAESDLETLGSLLAQHAAGNRPPAPPSRFADGLRRDQRRLEAQVLPRLRQALADAARREQAGRGSAELNRKLLGIQEQRICAALEAASAEHAEGVRRTEAAMRLLREACGAMGLRLGSARTGAAGDAPSERQALLREIAAELRRGGTLQGALLPRLERSEAMDLRVTLTEPDRESDFDRPGKICRERWEASLAAQSGRHGSSVARAQSAARQAKRHQAEGYQVLPGMLHSPVMRRGAAALFPRLLCQYSTGAGKTFVVYRTLREALEYNLPHLRQFHEARLRGDAEQMRRSAAEVHPVTYLCHSEEVVNQVRRSWEINGPEAADWFACAPNGGRPADPDHAERTESMRQLVDRYLFPGLNGTVKDEGGGGSKDRRLTFHFPDARQQELSQQTDGLVEYAFGPFFLMTFVQFAQVYLGAHMLTRGAEAAAGRRVPLRGGYVVDEAHNLVAPSKAATVHELAEEAEYWRVLQAAVQKFKRSGFDFQERVFSRVELRRGWESKEANLYLFVRKGGKYTPECRALCLHTTLSLLSHPTLTTGVTVMSLTATPEKVLGGTLALCTLGYPEQATPSSVSDVDRHLEAVPLPSTCLLREGSQVAAVRLGAQTVLEQKAEDGTPLRLMPQGAERLEAGRTYTVAFIRGDGEGQSTENGFVRLDTVVVRATASEMHRAFLVEATVLGQDRGAWVSHPASREQFRAAHFDEDGHWLPGAEERYGKGVQGSILFIEASGDPRSFPKKAAFAYGRDLALPCALQAFDLDPATASEMLLRATAALLWRPEADKAAQIERAAAFGAETGALWGVDPFGAHPIGGAPPLALNRGPGPRPPIVPPSDAKKHRRYAEWQKDVRDLCKRGQELLGQASGGPGVGATGSATGPATGPATGAEEQTDPMWFMQGRALDSPPAWLEAPEAYGGLPEGNVPVVYKNYGQRKQGFSQEDPALHFADGLGYWPAAYVLGKPGGDKWRPYVRYCEGLLAGSYTEPAQGGAAPAPGAAPGSGAARGGPTKAELQQEYLERFGKKAPQSWSKARLGEALGQQLGAGAVPAPCTARVAAMVGTVRRSLEDSRRRGFWFKWIVYFNCPEQSGAGPFCRACEEAVGTRTPPWSEMKAFADFYTAERSLVGQLRTAYADYVDECLRAPSANVSEANLEEGRRAALGRLNAAAAGLVRFWAGSTPETNLFDGHSSVLRAKRVVGGRPRDDDGELLRAWHGSARPRSAPVPTVLHAAQSSVGNESRAPEALEGNPQRAEQCRVFDTVQRGLFAEMFSDPRNNNGEFACAIAVSDWSKEGVDYKMVDGVLIDRPLPKMSDFDQLVGRGVRNCSKQPAFDALPQVDFDAESGRALRDQLDMSDPRFQQTPAERHRVGVVMAVARGPDGRTATTDAVALRRMAANQGERALIAQVTRCSALNAELHGAYLSGVGQGCSGDGAGASAARSAEEAAFFVPVTPEEAEELREGPLAAEQGVVRLQGPAELLELLTALGTPRPESSPLLRMDFERAVVDRLGGAVLRGPDYPLTPEGLLRHAAEEPAEDAPVTVPLRTRVGQEGLAGALFRRSGPDVTGRARRSLWTEEAVLRHLPQAVRLHVADLVHEGLERPMEARLRGALLACTDGVLRTRGRAALEAAECRPPPPAPRGTDLRTLDQLARWATGAAQEALVEIRGLLSEANED